MLLPFAENFQLLKDAIDRAVLLNEARATGSNQQGDVGNSNSIYQLTDVCIGASTPSRVKNIL